MQLQSIRVANANVAGAMRELLLVTEPAEAQALFDLMDKTAKSTSATFKLLEASVSSDAEKRLLDKLSAARASYSKPRQQVAQMVKAGKVDEAKQVLLKDLRPLQVAYMAAVEELMAHSQDRMDQAGSAVDAEVARTRWMVLMVVAASLAGAFAVGLWIIRSTTRPLQSAHRFPK